MMQTGWEQSGFIATSHDGDYSRRECPILNVCLSEQPKTLVDIISPFLMRRRSLSALFSLPLSNEPQFVMMRITGISNNFGLFPSVQCLASRGANGVSVLCRSQLGVEATPLDLSHHDDGPVDRLGTIKWLCEVPFVPPAHEIKVAPACHQEQKFLGIDLSPDQNFS